MKIAEIIFSLHIHLGNMSFIFISLIFQGDGYCKLLYDKVLIYIKFFNKPSLKQIYGTDISAFNHMVTQQVFLF